VKKGDVRQGTADRDSTSIADLVAAKIQYLQRFVLAAYELKNNMIMPALHYQSEKNGWQDMGTNVHPQRKNETYARPALSPEAPTAPIVLPQSSNCVRDAFWLRIKQNQTLIRPIINPKNFGWRDVKTKVHPKEQNEPYARPAPILDAPASPILLPRRSNAVRDVLWLSRKQK
jgi:hypothetical protein